MRSFFSRNNKNQNATRRLRNRNNRNRSVPRSRNLGPNIPNIVRQNNRSIPRSRSPSPILIQRGPIPRRKMFSIRPNRENNNFSEIHTHDLPSDPTQALNILNMRHPPNPETFYTNFTPPSSNHPEYRQNPYQKSRSFANRKEAREEAQKKEGEVSLNNVLNNRTLSLRQSSLRESSLRQSLLNEEIFRQMLIDDSTQLEEPATATGSYIPIQMYSNNNFLKEKKKDRDFINSVIEDHMLIYRTKGPDAAIRSWYDWMETHRKQFINSWIDKTSRYYEKYKNVHT